MTIAKRVELTLLDEKQINYIDIMQLYTVGNFMTITGFCLNITTPVTDKYHLSKVKKMNVNFNDE